MLLLLPLLIAAPQVSADEPGPPALEPDSVAAWRDHVRPSEDDLAFARIDWAPTFTDGLRRADAEQKPLLLWLMNGHPLGCT
ncbi:MAG: hypothetical protein AAF957_23285 [Planctomycetota bacterium]